MDNLPSADRAPSRWTGVGSTIAGAIVCGALALLLAEGKVPAGRLVLYFVLGAVFGGILLLVLSVANRIHWIGPTAFRPGGRSGLLLLGGGLGAGASVFLWGSTADLRVAVFASISGSIVPMLVVWPFVVSRTRRHYRG